METEVITSKDLTLHKLPPVNTGHSNVPVQSAANVKVLNYKKAQTFNYRSWQLGYNGFEVPEYDLYAVATAEDADGIVRQGIHKKTGLMFKHGWTITGQNQSTVKYIKQRFNQLGLSARHPIELLIREIGSDLFRFHNAFLLKVRSDKASSGDLRLVATPNGVKEVKPVAAYFRLPAETMRFKTDKYGNVLRYLQTMPDGRRQEFPAENVIHMYVNRRAGFNMACPGIWPAIEDIRTLRRIEEGMEVLVQQYLFPFFVFTIGTEKFPIDEVYEDGTTEVDVWTSKINEMPNEGGLVLTHRHKLEFITPDSVLPVEKYLEYWKNRAYVSMGMSGVDFGEGGTSNRSTSETISKNLIDDVKHYQSILKIFIEFEIISELLLEKYSAAVLSEEHMVTFEWNEIDVDSKIKQENHNAMMYNMNTITETEMRAQSNRGPVSNRSELFNELVTIPEKMAGSKATTSSGASASAKSKQQPSNQHKTNLGPTARKSFLRAKDLLLIRSLAEHLDTNGRDFTNFAITDWFFNLDFVSDNYDICSTLLQELHSLINNMDEMTDPNISKDNMLNDFISSVETIFQLGETNV